MKKVFLGGTCAGSTWRDIFIQYHLDESVSYFNPVVEEWIEECYQEELLQRQICDYVLYVITPLMKGVYSIAEVVDDSNKRPSKTIFCVLDTETILKDFDICSNELVYETLTFGKEQLKSLHKVGQMVRTNGGEYFNCLEDVAKFLNLHCSEK